MTKKKPVLVVPYSGCPKGKLYKPGRGDKLKGALIGMALLNASGYLHYFDSGDLCRIAHDEFHTVIGK